MKWLAGLTLLLLVTVVLAFLWHHALYEAYSRGSLSPAQFRFMNARMDLASSIGRAAFAALAAADLALIVVAARARSLLMCSSAALLALLLAIFFLMAQVSAGPAMIG